MKSMLKIFDNRSYKYVWRASVLMVLLLTGLIVIFGNIVFFVPFYAIPITLASWYGSRKTGILLTLFSALTLTTAKIIAVQSSMSVPLDLFDSLSFLLAYLGVAFIVTNFRDLHRIEVNAADTDDLTGISNSRSFYVELANELIRSHRYGHVFSLAYLDIDDFKHVNDSQGHLEGDRLLIEVAKCLKISLRKTDTAARLGGDEFACLFPETNQENANIAFENVSDMLKKHIKEHGWDVTFSAGLVTFETIPDDIKEALNAADELMYSVKNGEKNNIALRVWHGKSI
jgi:diguanylate cyclase (GGDEF)-like protein